MSKITIICPIYNTFPEIVFSMINQTHKNWVLLLIHDGPNSTNLKQLIDIIDDNRIKYIETEERQQQWGHPIRKWALDNIDELSPGTEYVVVTNDDNHHVPHFLEYLLKGFQQDTKVTYCSQFVHAYESWQKTSIVENMTKSIRNINWEVYKYGIIDTRLILGYIDIGCIMVAKNTATEIGWFSMNPYSDWEFIEAILNKYSTSSFKLVRGCLFIHN